MDGGVKLGSIVGTGGSITVSIGFEPDAVILFNGNDASGANALMFWAASMPANSAIKVLAGSQALVTVGGVRSYAGATGIAAKGFVIGTDADMNAPGEAISYLAMRSDADGEASEDEEIDPPEVPASSAIVLPGVVYMFGASSAAGGHLAADSGSATGTDDCLTNTVRVIEGLGAASLGYTTVSGSKVTRPVRYNLSAPNAAFKLNNYGASGATSGAGGTIVTLMDAQDGSFTAADFLVMHQGDNGLSIPGPNVPETLQGGYAAMRGLAGAIAPVAAGNFITIVNTQNGRGSGGAGAGEPPGNAFALVKAASLRIQSDLFPGRAFSFHETMMDRYSSPTAGELTDISQGMAPRDFMMNDGSHQIAKGYGLQADCVLTPVIDAYAGGIPFPVKQIIEAASPSVPAAGDALGSIIAYGSGGTFALDASNTQTDYAVSSSGVITRIGAVPPTRDITWAAVKTTKSGRLFVPSPGAAEVDNKVQPRIGICERAGPGVSRMVEFDGHSVLAMPDSKLANTSTFTMVMRLQATDQAITQKVFGGALAISIQLTTGGACDIVIRNAAGTVIFSKTTAANFRTIDPVRWVAVGLNLTDPAAEINYLTTWIDPATPTTPDTALNAGLTADTTTVHAVRLNIASAIGSLNITSSAGAVFGKFRIGDFTMFNQYIDFTDIARRQEISNADGTPKSAWVSGLGVTNGVTPILRVAGNAGDMRLGRITGSSIPATPGAAGQYMAYNGRERSPGVQSYLETRPA